MTNPDWDYDWLIVGSGFAGSVSALRLAEKGYRVGVIERGRRYTDKDLPESSWQFSKHLWAPKLGLKGIMSNRLFRHVLINGQNGVGGGSLVYGGVLFRARPEFFQDPQWRDLGDWRARLQPHYREAERMLGANTSPYGSFNQTMSREMAQHFGDKDSYALAPVAVFFGEAGKTVKDPYFGGEGPDRTGCTRCGDCLVGCRTGAANTLTKNYLWFAEKKGVQILPEREVVDVSPLGAEDGSDGYCVTTEGPGTWFNHDRQTHTARGVIFAGGAVGTNTLLANCKHSGSLPRVSDRLGELVRTNSETVVGARMSGENNAWHDVAVSSRLTIDGDTQVEILTYGRKADLYSLFFTMLVGDGNRLTRPLKWLGNIVRYPVNALQTLWPFGWSRRTLLMLVMQVRDNSINMRAKKRWFGRGFRIVTEEALEKPAPVYVEAGHRAAQWLAQRTGGIALGSVAEVVNIPTTVHLFGGAFIGEDASSGVVDENLRVFGYQNLLVCDAAAMPANPGVNPALTITAIAEYAMAQIPSCDQSLAK